MYSPCVECFNRYEKQYSNECIEKCEYAFTIDKIIEFAATKEIHERNERDKYEFGTSEWYYRHGEAEAYHDMVHFLMELKNEY